MSGAFNNSPMVFGAEEGSNLEAIQNSLLESKGTALTKDPESFMWAETLVYAKAIEYLWSTAQRFANQWNAETMTDFLPRWERIYGINPLPSETMVDRRRKVKIKMEMVGLGPTMQIVTDLLAIMLPDIFVEIIYTSSDEAVSQVPGGSPISGGAPLGDGDWYSTISYLAIKVQQPSYMDDKTFYEKAGSIHLLLDNLLPAWVTYKWFRENSLDQIGFILDDPHNLDNQALTP